ncbi:WD repeat-containing protein 43 [Mactra antiquata]
MDNSPMEFSENGKFLVQSSHDGTIKVWETVTNTLRSEYKPSSHLSATCSCLSWAPKTGKGKKVSKKKKQKRSSNQVIVDTVDDLQLVAIGTVSGTILLYSVAKGELQSQLENGHTDKVNDVVWYTESDHLYSCSDDTNIIEWEISSCKVKSKWKGDKGSVHSLCKCSSDHLLSAGRSINLWDINTKQVIQTFTGHSYEVFKMLHVPSQSGSSIEKSYFLSAAVNDRIVNAWQIDTKAKTKKAITTFTMPEDPVSMHISHQSGKPLILVVVTKCGKALIYEHALNGHLKKPLNPIVTVQISCESNKAEASRPLQILAAYVCNVDSHELLLAHGQHLYPNFEKVTYSSSQPVMQLVREDPMTVRQRKDRNITKVQTPGVSKEMTLLIPGQMAPSLPTQESQPNKRKRKASVGEMSLEDRLNAVSLEKPKSGQERPKTDKLVTLLVQGLQSQDEKLLDQVFRNVELKVVQNTIRNLPIHLIIPLVQEVTKRMYGDAEASKSKIVWIQTLLAVHTSYLTTFPEIIEAFSMLYQIMDSRVTMLGKLSRLKGKLDIIISQISAQTKEEEDHGTEQQALLQFEESSDEDDLEELAIGPGVSDSEDNWEDFTDEESDMDTQDDVNGKG